MDTEHPQHEIIVGLQKMVDWLKDNPQTEFASYVLLHSFPTDIRRAARELGSCEKVTEPEDTYFRLEKQFSPKVLLSVCKRRDDICERVKIGTKVIPAHPELVIPAKTIPATEERVEDVFEWKCPESILRGDVAEHLGDEYAKAESQS